MKTRKRRAEFSAQTFSPKEMESLTKLYAACRLHVESLVQEAEILYARRKDAKALFLASIAYEEFGKSQLIADYFYQSVTRQEFMDGFRDHKMKLAYAGRFVRHIRTSTGARTNVIVYRKSRQKWLFDYRNDALYLGMDGGFAIRKKDPRWIRKFAGSLIQLVNASLIALQKAENQCPYIGTRAFEFHRAETAD